jgi:N-acetyl-alpha-D-muramate 1-phosphate uridylyltransferase
MMKAMILSAGYGKRLYPLTESCPKPLIKIGNETLLSNTLLFLKAFGVQEVIINVHYLGNQIIDYINKKNFDLSINIVEEKNILDTGGGVLNAIQYFHNDPFLTINPDTIWNLEYLKELKLMEKEFLKNQLKCLMLIINKNKSFDKNLKGDFNLENNIISKKAKEDLGYIYTGLQIIRPNLFKSFNKNVFSISEVWDKLINTQELKGFESHLEFLHVSTLNVYKHLIKKNFKY